MQESRALQYSSLVSSPDQKGGSYKTDSQFEEDKDHNNVQYSADDESDPLRTRGPLRKFRGTKKSFDEDNNIQNGVGVSVVEKSEAAKSITSQRLQLFSNPCILRVKRKREEDALDQIYLEFDKQSGDLKKTKVVTEMQAIQAKLSLFGLDRQQQEEMKKSSQQQDYAIGKSQQKDGQHQSQPVLRLTKLRMPGTSAMAHSISKEGEGQIKEYCLNVINIKREQRRKDIIKEMRVGGIAKFSSVGQLQRESSIETDKEQVSRSIEDVKIIDFKQILKGKESEEMEEALMDKEKQQEIVKDEDNEDDEYVHDYYILDLEDQLATYNGTAAGDTLMHDIVKGGDDQLDNEHDSEDSNRESGDDKSYPDERSSFDEDQNDSSAEEDQDFDGQYERAGRGKKGRHSSGEDDDEERAAQRYNAKKNKSLGQLKNRIIDKLLEHPKKAAADAKQAQHYQQYDELLGYIPRIPEGSDDDQMQH